MCIRDSVKLVKPLVGKLNKNISPKTIEIKNHGSLGIVNVNFLDIKTLNIEYI